MTVMTATSFATIIMDRKTYVCARGMSMNERDAVRMVFRARPEMKEKLRDMYDKGKLKSVNDIPPNDAVIVVGGSGPSLIDGSKPYACAECGALVSLSPSSQEMMEKRGKHLCHIVCISCVVKEASKD